MEPNHLNTNMNDLFVDVRRAYRLLYLYQRRVMDLMKFIGGHYALAYSGGWSHFSNIAPRAGRGSLNLWAWDWLNMYHHQFYFHPKTIDNQSIQFAVFLVSDTGYYDATLTDHDKLNVKAFASPENADTCLVFLAGKGAWHGDFADFKINYKKDAADYVRNNEKGRVVAKSFPLQRFIDEASTIKALQEFTDFCNANGVPELGAFVNID